MDRAWKNTRDSPRTHTRWQPSLSSILDRPSLDNQPPLCYDEEKDVIALVLAFVFLQGFNNLIAFISTQYIILFVNTLCQAGSYSNRNRQSNAGRIQRLTKILRKTPVKSIRISGQLVYLSIGHQSTFAQAILEAMREAHTNDNNILYCGFTSKSPAAPC